MNTIEQTHPSHDNLAAFTAGRLNAVESDEIERHLVECENCCQILNSLPDNDTLVALLRDPEADTPLIVKNKSRPVATVSPEIKHGTHSPGGEITQSSSQNEGTHSFDLPPELRDHPRYRIVELLGRGGMGDVYKAEHKVMNRSVALKVIKRQLVQNDDAVRRFRREVQTAARLHHPNIVTAHDAEQAGDLHYLVMEYVDGVDLDAVIRERGTLPVDEACEYIRQTAEGLQHAHELGMVHRDIKPHNLMIVKSQESRDKSQGQGSNSDSSGSRPSALDSRPSVKILDFGLANFASETAVEELEGALAPAADVLDHLTQIGAMMGTPDYIAPEQAEDAHSADIRADIYSLGCTFYTLLAGQAPFGEGTVMDKIKAHTELDAPPVSDFRDDVSPEVEAILQKMMAKDPGERFQSPSEVAKALRPVTENVSVGRVSKPVPDGFGEPSYRKRKLTIAAVLLVVFLPLAYFYGGTVIRFMKNEGVLVVEVDDKNVEVVIKDQKGLVLRDKSTDREFVLTPVQGEIEVYDAGSNLKLLTKKFTLSRGGKEYVRVVPLDLTKERAKAKIPPNNNQGIGEASHEFSKPHEEVREARRFPGHTGTVKSVAISPDGKLAASASGWPHGDGSLRLWNLATGEEVRKFEGHTDQVMRVAFSPNGRWLVSGSTDRTARVWDVASGKQFMILPDHEGPVQAVAFMPDSNTVLTAPTTTDGSGKLRHWLFAADEVYKDFERDNGRVIDMAVSPDGQRVITGNDSSVRIWNMRGKLLRTVASPANQVESLAYSHDGRYFAVAAMSGKWIHVHDVESGAVFRTLVGTEGMRGVAFTPDDRHIVAAGLAGVVHIWDVQTGKEIARSKKLPEIIWSVAVSADGHTVLTGGGSKRIGQGKFERGSDFGLRLWKLPERVWPQVAEVCSFDGHDDRGSGGRLAVSPDGTLIATYQSGTVLIWDIGSAKQKYAVQIGEASIVSLVFLAHDLPMIAIGTSDVGYRDDSLGRVLIWDLESNKLHRQLSAKGAVHTLDLSPDGRQLAVAAILKDDAQTVLWDLETFKTRVLVEDEPVFKVAFSPNGKYVVTATNEEQGTVRLWDAKMGQPVKTLTRVMNPGQLMANLAFSPDSRGLAIAGGNWREQYGEVVLLDVPNLKFQRRIGRAEWKRPVEGIAFSPDGRWLALSASDDVHLLDPATTNDVARFKASRKPGFRSGADLAFSADGRSLFTAAVHENAKMWQLPRSVWPRDSVDPEEPVKGTVTIDGKPAKGATVTFHPTIQSNMPPMFTTVDAKGRYALTLPAGRYQVTIKDVATERYEQLAKSSLVVEVVPGDNEFSFELTTN